MKIARIRAGMSQEELAAAAGIKEGTYGRYERSDRHIDVETLSAVAHALHLMPTDIIGAALQHSPEAFRFTAEAEGEDVGPHE